MSDSFLEYFLPGKTPEMQRLRETIARINLRFKNPPHMGRSVLLLGETGVGKNHIARVIAGHLYWLRDPRCWHPPGTPGKTRSLLEVTAENFAQLSLPNLPSDLIESELFGHVRGAFTGAVEEKDGYFGDEHIHDLLLDEIGEAKPDLQTKLLHVLNDRSFKKVGAAPHKVRFTEARILLATNRDLAEHVRRGEFRSDLYWRIQHVVVRIPPLRDQRERIPALAETLALEIQRSHSVASEQFLRLSPTDLDWAKRQPWPGNVRELERLVWRWIYEDGKRSLADIQREYPEEHLRRAADGASIKALVRAKIASALDGKEPLADSVGEFARHIEREAQLALYELKNDLNLDRRALGALFGDGERAAKQISAWGEKARS